jgi:Hint domain
MAISIDLGQTSPITIDTSNIPTDGDVNLTLASNGTVIVNGVNATFNNLIGGNVVSNTTIEAINGAHVTVTSNAAGIAAGSQLTYDIGAGSSVAVQAGLANVGLLNSTTVNFQNTGGTGQFTVTPAAINLSLTTPPVVTGLSNGDKISLTGATSASLSGGVLTFQYPGLLGVNATMAFTLQGIPAGSTVTFDNATDTVVFACFLRGTMIATPYGEVAVEDLRPGDVVLTLNRGRSPIRWIGRRVLDPLMIERPQDAWPIRIRRGAVTENVPHRDLLVSPDHCLLVQDVLIPAKLLVNGVSIVQEERHEPFEYFHIELDNHDVILAEGMLSESYLDLGNRHMFLGPGVAQVLPTRPTASNDVHCYPPHYSGPIYDGVYRQLHSRGAQFGSGHEQRLAS